MDYVTIAYKVGAIKEALEYGEVKTAIKFCAELEDALWQAAQQGVQADVAKYCPQCGNKYDGILCGECGFTTSPRR